VSNDSINNNIQNNIGMNHIEEILKVSGIIVLSLISIGSMISYISERIDNNKIKDKEIEDKDIDEYEDGHYEGEWN